MVSCFFLYKETNRPCTKKYKIEVHYLYEPCTAFIHDELSSNIFQDTMICKTDGTYKPK